MPKQPLPEGVNASTVLTDVSVGKYRWIYHFDARGPEAFRDGVYHKPTRDHMTANSVRALIERVALYDTLLENCSVSPLTDEGLKAYDEIMKDRGEPGL